MENKVKTLLIGVGNLGEHHARILKGMDSVELLGVVDTDPVRGREVANKYSVEYLPGIDKANPTAAVIVTPTPTHYAIAREILGAGIHCFVEKPVTQTIEEADELIKIARERNLVFQVGHIERFNPAIEAAKPFINSPRFIEAQRMGPYSPRMRHVGVVMDLMIHDIDILLYLVGSGISDIEAYGTRVFSTSEDIAKVRIKFSNGCIADLTASRVSFEKSRLLRVFQVDNYISVDYMTREVKVFSKKIEMPRDLSDISIEKPVVKTYDQLERELGHFIECVKQGKKPLVQGEHGRDALEVVHEILKIIKH